MTSYDLLIQGGTVIDPAAGVHARRDVAVADGRVAAVEASIPAEQATRSLDASGKLVVPGLIDLHAHIFRGIGDGADAERDCLARGTTTIYDGGSTGWRSFEGLREYVIERVRPRVKAWLNISSIGLVDTSVGELMNLGHVNAAATADTARANQDVIVGFKIRLSGYVAGANFHPALRAIREAADATGLRIMAHIGETFEPLPVALEYFRPGDVVTHSFTGRRHGILDYQGQVLPAVREARANGVIFDAAHGRMHFGFQVIRRALDQGFLVDTLSTDITTNTAADPTFGLPLLMSKLIALGVGLDDAVALCTANPARVMGRQGEIGTLQPGALADVSILEQQEGDFTLYDNEGQSLQTNQRLQAWRTVIGGEVIEAV